MRGYLYLLDLAQIIPMKGGIDVASVEEIL